MSEDSKNTENKTAENNSNNQDNARKNKDYTDQYVEQIRTENHNLRLKIEEVQKLKNDELTQKDNDYKKTIEEKISTLSEGYKKEIIVSKLETEALRAGIIDPEIVKIIDLSQVKFDENNKIVGLKEAIDKFKEEKPHLFKKNESSSYEKGMPAKKTEAEDVDAMKMKTEEWNKLRAKLIS